MLLQYLGTFEHVVIEHSFTRAARSLHLSQPTVTKQVAALEEEFGATLLSRRGGQVALTAAGHVVYHCAQQVRESIEEAHRQVKSLTDPDHGEVNIGCVETLVPTTLAATLQDFIQKWPHVRLNVQIGAIQETVDRLIDGEIDVALLTMEVNDARLISFPLYKDRIILVAHPRLLAQLPRELTLTDLNGLQLITHRRGSRFRSLVDGTLERYGVLPDVIMEFDNHEAVRVMTELGLGVGLLPLSAVEDAIAAGTLLEVQMQGFPLMVRTTTLAARARRSRAAAEQAFVTEVLGRYGLEVPDEFRHERQEHPR